MNGDTDNRGAVLSRSENRPAAAGGIDGSFLAMLFRLKFINRWSRMYVTQPENLSIHTVECAYLVHFLAHAGNAYFGKSHDPEKLAVAALYHDASEILTGDMPTPIKYFNPEIQTAYKDIEHAAAETLLERLPEKLREAYRPQFTREILNDGEKALLKAADRLCAYLKCVTEIHAGNHEFLSAAERIRTDLEALRSEEVDFFLENCAGSFPLALDELQMPVRK